MTSLPLKLRAERPASRPAAAPLTRRRRLPPVACVALAGYAVALLLLCDVVWRVF